jgi:hypothetical protein
MREAILFTSKVWLSICGPIFLVLLLLSIIAIIVKVYHSVINWYRYDRIIKK